MANPIRPNDKPPTERLRSMTPERTKPDEEEHRQLWPPPPTGWELGKQDLHVWSVSIDPPLETLSALSSTLSEAERERAARFRFEQQRARFAAGRGLLRQILGCYLHCQPAEIIFSYGPQGKPELAGQFSDRRLAFNLSHSGKLALVAVSGRGAVGVDIERVCRLAEAEDIARRFFSAEERLRLRGAPVESRARVFFEIWTGKEAVLKSAGRGIPEIEKEAARGFEGFMLALKPAGGYVGNVAMAPPPVNTRLWRWPA